VLRLHPWSEPRTLREPGGRRVPSFRSGARGIDGRKTAAAAALETREFRHEHEEVRVARRDGDTGRSFPFGTYAARVLHGAPVEPQPKPTALVTRPGPLLSQIRQEADDLDKAEREALHADSLKLLDEVREAFDEEAPELVAEDHLDFERDQDVQNLTRPDAAPADGSGRVVRRHRFDREPRDGELAGVRRVVILRDARRGRPATGSSRHGVDPPG
jgi:hypothetical protein